MAAKTITTSDAATKKLWAARPRAEATWGSLFMDKRYGFMKSGDEGDSALIKEYREFKQSGDEVTLAFHGQIIAQGTVGGAPIEGTETGFDHFTQKFLIEELASPPYGSKYKGDEQRVPWKVVKSGQDLTKEWWVPILNAGPMLHLCGSTFTQAANYYRPATRPILTGNANGLGHQWTCMNPVTAPSANRIMRANDEADDQSLTTESTHKMTVELLDELIATSSQCIPPLRPVKWAGGENFLVFIHTDQAKDLQDDPKYDSIKTALLQGGLPYEQSSYATGNIIPYGGCVIIVSNWNPPGQNSSTAVPVANTRRAVFCGAGALAMGWGVGEGQNRFSFHGEKYNIGGSYRCVTRAIYGGKKVIRDSVDYATYVLTTYAKNRGDTGA